MIHELKTWPEVMSDVFNGLKTFEYRYNDRNYQVGDTLILREYDPKTSESTGKYIVKKVTYIIHGGKFGIPDGYCIMSIV